MRTALLWPSRAPDRSRVGRSVADRVLVDRPRSAQGGFSLMEVLIAVALAGAVVLGLASGLLAMVRTNAETAEQQKMEIWVGSFAESLTAAQYRFCNSPTDPPTPAGYQAAYESWADRWVPPSAEIDLRVTDVEFWDSAATPAGFQPACGAADQMAQRLTIEVRHRDRTANAQIVKVPA